jgi:hypothetical protein
MDQDLASLQRRRDELVSQGIWTNCWIETAKPGGTAGGDAMRYRARAHKGQTFESGKRTKYVAAADLGWVRGCIQRGQEVARLDRAIVHLAKASPHDD